MRALMTKAAEVARARPFYNLSTIGHGYVTLDQIHEGKTQQHLSYTIMHPAPGAGH